MSLSLLQLYRHWRLRRAKESYALWKARKEEWQRQLAQDPSFARNPYNRHRTIHAAGKEAQYLERVEELHRQL